MSKLHPVEYLFDKLAKQVDPFCPKGVIPVQKRIPGKAFFPGGAGLWNATLNTQLPPMPTEKIMIVGQDFDSWNSYQNSLARGSEDIDGPTWGPLRQLLNRSDIRPEDCFFTNAYMGIRLGPATGKFPGASDSRFKQLCQAFLEEQIAVQQPRLILTLGKYIPEFIAILSSDLAAWKRCKSLTDIDAVQKAMINNVRFKVCPKPCSVAALTHPCFRHLNIGQRRYKGLQGDTAELALLADAIKVSGL
jgi:uracil-DNA glycosylase